MQKGGIIDCISRSRKVDLEAKSAKNPDFRGQRLPYFKALKRTTFQKSEEFLTMHFDASINLW